MSSLSDPLDNPHAFRIAAVGMGVGGLLLALLGLCVRSALQKKSPTKWTEVATWFLVLSGILLTASALILPGNHEFLGLARAHARFAQAAAATFDLAMILTLPALIHLPNTAKRVRTLSIVLALIPTALYLLARRFVPNLAAQNPDYRAAHPHMIASLAFWEWTGSIVVFLYLSTVLIGLADFGRKD